jgi:serine/threonine protein kinase/CheY-like chemotaxis protein/outer membrane biosynthesis protein TonB
MTKNILLVEYDESTIQVIKELFHPPVFELAVASDGEAAKKLLNARDFDLMITAAMLPRFHGFNLALAVSQDHPGMKTIIISAIYKGLEYKHQAVTQYRANDFFEKPLDREKFKQRVLDLLGVSDADLNVVSQAATTQVPVFDTAKIPAPRFDDDEENKLSSADIFGDIIQKIDQVPSFEIDLGEGAQPAAKKEEPRRADPSQTVLQKKEAQPARQTTQPDPARTRVAEPVFDLDKLKEVKKTAPPPAPHPSAQTQRIDASLEGLRQQQVKRETPENKMRKIEDDIARKFEDTLSGLGLGKKPAPPPRPEPAPAAKAPATPEPKPAPPQPPAPKVIVKEIQKTTDDEIIELGEDALREIAPAAPAAVPAPVKQEEKAARGKEESPEVKETKAEKKKPAEDNPNEVGDYVLLGMIARGGMAEIYKAKKKGVKGFEKVIAIKKILSGYGEDDKYIEMLVDEAKIAAELSHPNIVQIYDLGRKDNYYFIAMEYVLGKDLREIQTRLRERDKWFPEEIALYLTIKILEALNYAHKAKDSRGRPLEIVHRDVSPPNILISYNGDVKLTDFGVSKATIKIHQTLSGALKGKLLYMSPEQACGESGIDYRSDLYSAGVLLFELLTGKKLFLDTTEMMVLKKVQNGEIIPPRDINPDIDPTLEKILLTSLNKDCNKRYQSAASMIADLEAYIHKKYDRAPGPVHLSHFIYNLFEADIQRDGIKVDLKPIPFVPRPREIAKPQPPPEIPLPVVEIPAAPPPPLPPPPAQPPEAEGLVSISFDDDKDVSAPKRKEKAVQPPFRPESIFTEAERGKKKFPLWPLAVLLFVGAAAAGIYFLVLNKPAALPVPADLRPAAGEQAGPVSGAGEAEATPLNGQEIAEPAAAAAKKSPELPGAVPAATQKLLDEAKLKQEEELKKIQAEEEKKKLLEDKRKKQAEADRLKKEEEDRKQREETARLQLEEENRRKQEEQARLRKEEEDRKKTEELKRIEQSRVKEGDIVPLGEVDSQPVAISTPSPIIPAAIRATMPDSQALMLMVLIDQNGDVETVRMLQKSNNSQLNTILTDMLKTWKYQPARKNSVRVKVWKTVPMTIKK